MNEAVARRCSVKKVILEIFANFIGNICARVSLLIKLQASTYNFIKKETLAQVFSCNFCETFKNIFFTEHLRTTVSECFKLVDQSNKIQEEGRLAC